MSRTQLWVEKYRPTSIDDLASQEEVTKTLRGAIAQGQLPHLLMYGPPGTGKTSTILAVARTLYHPSVLKDRVLEMNASDERGIKIVRDKIKNFASQTASDATSRRPHAIDATRLHQRRRWVVFFSSLSRFGRDRDSTCHTQVSDILFTGGDPMIMKTNMCGLRVLRCCGAFTSLDGLVAISRGRGWFLSRF